MKTIFFCFAQSVLITIIGCSSNVHTDQKNEVEYYTRNIGGGTNNGKVADTTYFDFLKMKNYTDGSLPISFFYETAKKYRDTIKTDKYIASVTFLGENSNNILPNPGYNNPILKYELVSFGFIDNKLLGSDLLTNITLTEKGEKTLYWYQIPSDKKKIDSLLRASENYRNGFASQ